MIYIYQGIVPHFTWTIWKSPSAVRENFSNAVYKVVLYGPANKYVITPVTINAEGALEGDFPVGLPVGVYSMKAFWTKDAMLANGRVLSSEQNCFVAFTANPDEAEQTSGSLSLTLQSNVSTYGQDGLSAYEIAVLYGETTLDEQTWITSISGAAEAFVAAEEARNTAFNQAQNNRATAFTELMTSWGSSFNGSEAARQQAFNAFLAAAQQQVDHISVAQSFGANTNLAVSQDAVTKEFVRVWNKMQQITGETNLFGFTMDVNPTFYTDTTGALVDVTVTADTTVGRFDKIELYINDEEEPRHSAENVEEVEWTDIEITGTTLITCKATILGVEYTQSQTVARHDPYYVGAGGTYSEVVEDDDNRREFVEGLRANYDITFANGDNLYVIIATDWASEFIRADLNGFEIPMTSSTVTINGLSYTVFVSQSPYQAGTYNIDING